MQTDYVQVTGMYNHAHSLVVTQLYNAWVISMNHSKFV